jgi:hypothetical protein
MTTSSKVFGFSSADLRSTTAFLAAVVLASQHVLLLNRAIPSKYANKTLSSVRTTLEKLLAQHLAGTKSTHTRLVHVLRALEALTKGTVGFRNGALTYKLLGTVGLVANLAKVVDKYNDARTVLTAEQSKALGSLVRNGNWDTVVAVYEGSDSIGLATQMQADYSSAEGRENLVENHKKFGIQYMGPTTHDTNRVYITIALTPEIVHHRAVKNILHRFRGNAAFHRELKRAIEGACTRSVRVDSADAVEETEKLVQELVNQLHLYATEEDARAEARNQKAAKEIAAAAQLSEAMATLKGNPTLMKKTLQSLGVL